MVESLKLQIELHLDHLSFDLTCKSSYAGHGSNFTTTLKKKKHLDSLGKNGSFLPTKNGNISRALSLTSNLASNRYIQSIQFS